MEASGGRQYVLASGESLQGEGRMGRGEGCTRESGIVDQKEYFVETALHQKEREMSRKKGA